MNRDKYCLYFDDTGNRYPGTLLRQPENRTDGMNCFGLGGLLIKEEHVKELVISHKQFCTDWNIDYPLHSSKIRGGRREFSWLRTGESQHFLSSLQDFLLSLPFVGIACIIDRPGYLARYSERCHDQLWHMCKTTFCILVERSAKYADENGRDLEIYFEQSGKIEDRNIVEYLRDLKLGGNQFSEVSSKDYEPLTAEDYRRIILGEPHRLSKESPPIQIADLVLYPIAKSGYDASYNPYMKMKEAKKLIDSLLSDAEVPIKGIKYSCF